MSQAAPQNISLVEVLQSDDRSLTQKNGLILCPPVLVVQRCCRRRCLHRGDLFCIYSKCFGSRGNPSGRVQILLFPSARAFTSDENESGIPYVHAQRQGTPGNKGERSMDRREQVQRHIRCSTTRCCATRVTCEPSGRRQTPRTQVRVRCQVSSIHHRK